MCFTIFFAALWLSHITTAGATTPFKQGDRVVFYGDSITQQQLYTRYLQQYVYGRYPELKVRFYNAGWSGDRATGAVTRLQRDVLALNPTVVTLFFGMNDGRYRPIEDATAHEYRTKMDQLIQTLKAEGVRVIVMTPGCVDVEHRQALADVGYNDTLAALAGIARELAEKHECEFVNMYDAMLAFQTQQKQADAAFTMIPDGVHPNARGHLLMTAVLLGALSVSPPTLGEVDAARGSAQGDVELVRSSTTQVELKAVLPVPYWIEPEMRPFAETCGMSALTHPRLVVRGLSEGEYSIELDGAAAGDATASQLAAGVALQWTEPAGKQLFDLVVAKEQNYFAVWRNVQLSQSATPGIQEVVAAMMQVDDAFHNAIHALADARKEATITITHKQAASP
jgi:lysophospholipase L1-like esterase